MSVSKSHTSQIQKKTASLREAPLAEDELQKAVLQTILRNQQSRPLKEKTQSLATKGYDSLVARTNQDYTSLSLPRSNTQHSILRTDETFGSSISRQVPVVGINLSSVQSAKRAAPKSSKAEQDADERCFDNFFQMPLDRDWVESETKTRKRLEQDPSKSKLPTQRNLQAGSKIRKGANHATPSFAPSARAVKKDLSIEFASKPRTSIGTLNAQAIHDSARSPPAKSSPKSRQLTNASPPKLQTPTKVAGASTHQSPGMQTHHSHYSRQYQSHQIQHSEEDLSETESNFPISATSEHGQADLFPYSHVQTMTHDNTSPSQNYNDRIQSNAGEPLTTAFNHHHLRNTSIDNTLITPSVGNHLQNDTTETTPKQIEIHKPLSNSVDLSMQSTQQHQHTTLSQTTSKEPTDPLDTFANLNKTVEGETQHMPVTQHKVEPQLETTTQGQNESISADEISRQQPGDRPPIDTFNSRGEQMHSEEGAFEQQSRSFVSEINPTGEDMLPSEASTAVTNTIPISMKIQPVAEFPSTKSPTSTTPYSNAGLLNSNKDPHHGSSTHATVEGLDIPREELNTSAESLSGEDSLAHEDSSDDGDRDTSDLEGHEGGPGPQSALNIVNSLNKKHPSAHTPSSLIYPQSDSLSEDSSLDIPHLDLSSDEETDDEELKDKIKKDSHAQKQEDSETNQEQSSKTSQRSINRMGDHLDQNGEEQSEVYEDESQGDSQVDLDDTELIVRGQNEEDKGRSINERRNGPSIPPLDMSRVTSNLDPGVSVVQSSQPIETQPPQEENVVQQEKAQPPTSNPQNQIPRKISQFEVATLQKIYQDVALTTHLDIYETESQTVFSRCTLKGWKSGSGSFRLHSGLYLVFKMTFWYPTNPKFNLMKCEACEVVNITRARKNAKPESDENVFPLPILDVEEKENSKNSRVAKVYWPYAFQDPSIKGERFSIKLLVHFGLANTEAQLVFPVDFSAKVYPLTKKFSYHKPSRFARRRLDAWIQSDLPEYVARSDDLYAGTISKVCGMIEVPEDGAGVGMEQKQP
eukprot:TRINITY_DN3665_c0_g1_i6.p1 TRINITY_DN3665_c0_g1~~TRINITY_DN3665_c0_g1_i6.p1  ORF type:complete len:1035 (+),score=206.26 TRINITY_DN3665_c0_g1_i6:297-3401(+)